MISLDDLNALRKHDRSGMASIIASFPAQCRDALGIGMRANIPNSFKRSYANIICTGMGGSAIGADIARSYISDIATVPVFVNRNYTLPAFVGRSSLVVVSSYSGNTEETISAFKDAADKGAHIIAITTGGKIKELAARRSIPVVSIPSGLPPRAALGYSFFTLITILSRIGVIRDKSRDIEEAITGMEKLNKAALAPEVRGNRNIAKEIARRIYSKIPVIYSDINHMDAVSTRWRGQIAENAKSISSVNFFPELSHNEIVGWQNPKNGLRNLAVIMLKDSGHNPRTRKRMDIVKRMVRSLGVDVIEIRSRGRGLLARIFSLIYIGDYVSLYLAALYNCDPTPVEKIAYLKREMSR